MYGVSKIGSEENIMLVTFPSARYSTKSLADYLNAFAKAGVIVDMICQPLAAMQSISAFRQAIVLSPP